MARNSKTLLRAEQCAELEKRETPSKRDSIAAEAFRLFLEQGYGNTSLQQIAKETNTSASLIIYHFGSKRAIASAYLDRIMSFCQRLLYEYVDMREEPELFCSSSVLLYQTVMNSKSYHHFYRECIDEGIYWDFFFSDEKTLNVCDLIIAKRQVEIPAKQRYFYSHYIMPSIELGVWKSSKDGPLDEDLLELSFRAFMGILNIPKEETDYYCTAAREKVQQILKEHPEVMVI